MICVSTFGPCFVVIDTCMVIDSSEAITLTKSAKCSLSAAEVYEYLIKAGNVYKESTCLGANSPVQPRKSRPFKIGSE